MFLIDISIVTLDICIAIKINKSIQDEDIQCVLNIGRLLNVIGQLIWLC